MKSFIRFTALVLSVFLGGCSATLQGHKLDPDAQPINGLAVQIYTGDVADFKWATSADIAAYRTTFKEAFSKRFPETFRNNGVVLPSVLIYSGKSPLQAVPVSLPPNAKISHVLVLQLQRIFYMGRYGGGDGPLTLYYDATLIDAKTLKPVWTATPGTLLVVSQPNRRIEFLAGSILSGLSKDNLLTLKAKFPVDKTNSEIRATTPFSEDN